MRRPLLTCSAALLLFAGCSPTPLPRILDEDRPGEPQPPAEVIPTWLEVVITPTGHSIAVQGVVQPPVAGCPADGVTICKKSDGAYDWAKLYASLVEIKAQRPLEDSLTLSAHAEVPYDNVVRTMDLSRSRLAMPDDAPPDADPFEVPVQTCATDAPACADLFPNVTFKVNP